MVSCVIPAYKAATSVCAVVSRALEYADFVIVVDDGCPNSSGSIVQSTFRDDPRVVLIVHETNRGVGAAMKVGIAAALARDASVIIKLDADGQMDPEYIPTMVAMFEADPSIAYVKGNRFFDPSILARMPKIRLFGNALLSLFVKFASGYWNILDPTNGYVAFNATILRGLRIDDLADSYFFEISVVGMLGLKRLPIAELEMETIYGSERSSLAIRRVAFEFPPRLFALFFRRIAFQYFLADINLGTLYLVLGAFMSIAGLSFGLFSFSQTWHTGVARTPGTIMLAFLPILIGVQLLMNALMYDVQFGPKTIRDLVSARRSR